MKCHKHQREYRGKGNQCYECKKEYAKSRGMDLACPLCAHEGSLVVNSRATREFVKRRRQCHGCKVRWTTIELSLAYVDALLRKETLDLLLPARIRPSA